MPPKVCSFCRAVRPWESASRHADAIAGSVTSPSVLASVPSKCQYSCPHGGFIARLSLAIFSNVAKRVWLISNLNQRCFSLHLWDLFSSLFPPLSLYPQRRKRALYARKLVPQSPRPATFFIQVPTFYRRALAPFHDIYHRLIRRSTVCQRHPALGKLHFTSCNMCRRTRDRRRCWNYRKFIFL